MSLPATEVATRAVARATGEATLAFLHDTTTAELAALRPGEGALTCYLDEKGRLLAELRVAVLPDGVLLDGEPASRDGMARLARIAPLSGVTITDEDLVLTQVRGDADLSGFSDLPAVEHGCVARDGVVAIRTDWGGAGYDFLSPSPLGLASPLDPEVLRVTSGRPRFGVDIEPGTLVNETPLLARAVSHAKGCYPGQESVARVHNLGSVRRRFVLLRLSGSLPGLPATVTVEGDEVGRMTSAASDLGIAFVRASLAEAARVDAGGTAAVVERLL